MKFMINAVLWKKVVDAARRIAKEPPIIFEPAGMSIVAVDPPKVSLLQLSLRKSVFDYYDVEERTVKCFSLGDMSKFVAGAAGVADVTIDDKVKIMMPSTYGFKMFDLPLFYSEEEAVIPVNLPLASTCKIDIEALIMALRDAKRVGSEYLTIIAHEDMIEAVAKGDSSTATNKLGEKAIIKSSFEEGNSSIFMVNNIEKVLLAGNEFTNIALMRFDTDRPIEFRFQTLFDGILNGFVAPCVGGE